MTRSEAQSYLEYKSIKELQALLTEKGINAKGEKKKLQVVAVRNGLDIKKTVTDIEQGLVNRPKGSFKFCTKEDSLIHQKARRILHSLARKTPPAA
jgi:hypothetical protein